MTEEEGHDQESAENICGALQAEAKSDNGNVEQLREALEQGRGLISDVAVELNSAVDVPAIDSKWVAMKSVGDDAPGENNRKIDTPVVLKQSGNAEERIAYAPAMIPREPDKEGDVVPTPVVEDAAHGYLENDGDVDTDHSLIDGKGTVVESWIEPDERTWDLPDGGTETYPPGTWMLGIKWEQQPWERIQNGELTGLSIYGKAEHVPLAKAAAGCECDCHDAEATATGDTDKGGESESSGMGDETDDSTETNDGPDIAEVAQSVDDLAESVATVKEAVETQKQDAEDGAAMIADEYEEVSAGDVLDLVEMAASRGLDDVMSAIEDAGEEMVEEADEQKADDEGETTEKRTEDANLEKGADSTATASKGITGEGGTGEPPSYAAVAAQREEEI